MTPGGKGVIVRDALSIPVNQKNLRAVEFGRRLRAEMLHNGNISSRELGRRLTTKNLSTGAARRNVMRYLAGDNYPSRASRNALADALGISRETFADEDDEEADLNASLARALREIARHEAERVLRRTP